MSDDLHDLRRIAEAVAAQARPGEQLEAYVARNRSTSVKAYGGEVEAFTSATSMGIGIRVIDAGRQGFAYAGTLDDDVIASTLADARDNVAFGEVDEHYGLASPDGVAPPSLDLWRDDVASYADADKIALAIELERRVRAGDPRIAGVRTASYGDACGASWVATSTGISVGNRGTFCSLAVTALATADGETTVGGGHDLARRPGDLRVDKVVDDAVTRATRLLGARQPASQRLTVVLEPRLAATIVGLVAGTLTGEAVAKRRSPFADRMGEAIAASALSIVEDPTDPRSFGSDTHDGEGLATRRTVLVDQGVLRAFLHNSYSARRAGTTSTASAVRGVRSTPGVGATALAMVPGARPAAALLAGVERGLFVQSLTGLHSGVNMVSGDFSVGVDGLMIRDGALAEPVREATLASTIQRLLADIVEVGADLEWLPGGSGAATLVIDGVTLSGA